MIEVGRLCVKIAGRDSGLKCVIVDVIDKTNVLIDGQTRRRKCNISHIEPLAEVIKIKKNATHSEVVSELKKIDIEVKEKVTKERKVQKKEAETPKKEVKSEKIKSKPKK